MIRQGQKYELAGRPMLAMENTDAPIARVREIIIEELSGTNTLGPEEIAVSAELKPMTMRYHGNQIP